MRTGIVCMLCLVWAATFAGCGSGDGPERVVVSGKVSYQGQPVSDGEIRFVPTEGTTGPTSGGKITDGAYKVDLKGGVVVGANRVEIKAYRTMEGAQPLPPGAGPAEGEIPKEQYLPEKFNSRSELKLTIESPGGPTTQDYELTE